MGIGQIKMTQNYCYYRNYFIFFNTQSFNFWKPLVDFQSSEKGNFDTFHWAFIAIMKEQIFRGLQLQNIFPLLHF